jgi:ABC-type polysaccharide/polyol phosphate export permease
MRIVKDLATSIREPHFWMYSSWLDVLTKYRRTRVGIAWALIPTAVFIVVLGTIYGQLMSMALDDYLPFLCLGYMLWRFLTHVLNESAGIFRSHQAYIQQGRVTLTDYLLRMFAKASFYFVMTLPVLVGVFVWSRSAHVLDLWTLMLTLPVFAAAVFIIGGHVAFLTARFPDVSEVINTILIFAFLLTPILWHPSHAPSGAMLGLLMRVNPAFHLLEFVREPALGNSPSLYTIQYVAGFVLLGAASLSYIYGRYANRVPFWN